MLGKTKCLEKGHLANQDAYFRLQKVFSGLSVD